VQHAACLFVLSSALRGASTVATAMTSNAKAEGRFDKADFIYIAKDDEYQCPAGQRVIHRTRVFKMG
jgi:hypothetical protein